MNLILLDCVVSSDGLESQGGGDWIGLFLAFQKTGCSPLNFLTLSNFTSITQKMRFLIYASLSLHYLSHSKCVFNPLLYPITKLFLPFSPFQILNIEMETIIKQRSGSAKNQRKKKKELFKSPNQKVSVDCPKELTINADAQYFWEKHATHLSDSDLLNVATFDYFVQLCNVYAFMKLSTRKLFETEDFAWAEKTTKYTSQFDKGCRQFCLTPQELRKSKVIVNDTCDKNRTKDKFEF